MALRCVNRFNDRLCTTHLKSTTVLRDYTVIVWLNLYNFYSKRYILKETVVAQDKAKMIFMYTEIYDVIYHRLWYKFQETSLDCDCS